MILGLLIVIKNIHTIMFIHLPIEIWQCILNSLDFKSQIIMRMVCKLFYEKLEIWDFNNISFIYTEKFTDTILLAYPFIRYLYAARNQMITNVNHLTNLQILRAWGTSCGISDNGIKNIDLIFLDVDDNPKITNVNHLTNLQKLWAGGTDCGIDDNGIKNLNLIELHADNNPKITNVNHLTNLQKLWATGYCGIDDTGIKDLKNLIELHANYNPKITKKID